jgi:hypothetical protein
MKVTAPYVTAALAAAAFAGLLLPAVPAAAGPSSVTIQVSDATVYEGDGGVTYASFEVRRTGRFTGKTQTVRYRTTDGTATAGSDYTAATGSLVYDSKHAVRTVTVEVLGDTDQEDDEFFLLLVTPSGGGDGEGRGTILNDDGWPSI